MLWGKEGSFPTQVTGDGGDWIWDSPKATQAFCHWAKGPHNGRWCWWRTQKGTIYTGHTLINNLPLLLYEDLVPSVLIITQCMISCFTFIDNGDKEGALYKQGALKPHGWARGKHNDQLLQLLRCHRLSSTFLQLYILATCFIKELLKIWARYNMFSGVSLLAQNDSLHRTWTQTYWTQASSWCSRLSSRVETELV